MNSGVVFPSRTCTVLKVFPISNFGLETHSTMKLSRKKILWIIRQKEKQESSGVIAKIQHITRRRVDQLWKIYQDTGTIPIIGQQMGRPKKKITPEESEIIDEAYQRFRYGVRMLEILIQGDYNATISHNRIYSYLMGRG